MLVRTWGTMVAIANAEPQFCLPLYCCGSALIVMECAELGKIDTATADLMLRHQLSAVLHLQPKL